MQFQYRGFYFYLGFNGIIIALDFDFKGKAYDLELAIFGVSFSLDEIT